MFCLGSDVILGATVITGLSVRSRSSGKLQTFCWAAGVCNATLTASSWHYLLLRIAGWVIVHIWGSTHRNNNPQGRKSVAPAGKDAKKIVRCRSGLLRDERPVRVP